MYTPDLPWGTLIMIGAVLYGGLLLFISRTMKDYRTPYVSFDCWCGCDWHYRCNDLDCECDCHE